MVAQIRTAAPQAEMMVSGDSKQKTSIVTEEIYEKCASVVQRAVNCRYPVASVVLPCIRVEEEAFEEKLNDLIATFASENAQATLKWCSLRVLAKKGADTEKNAPENRYHYAYINSRISHSGPLGFYAPDFRFKHEKLNFFDVLEAVVNEPQDPLHGDVWFVRIEGKHASVDGLAKDIVVIKTKNKGAYLMLAVHSNSAGEIESLKPAFGFDTRIPINEEKKWFATLNVSYD